MFLRNLEIWNKDIKHLEGHFPGSFMTAHLEQILSSSFSLCKHHSTRSLPLAFRPSWSGRGYLLSLLALNFYAESAYGRSLRRLCRHSSEYL